MLGAFRLLFDPKKRQRSAGRERPPQGEKILRPLFTEFRDRSQALSVDVVGDLPGFFWIKDPLTVHPVIDGARNHRGRRTPMEPSATIIRKEARFIENRRIGAFVGPLLGLF